MTTKYKNPPIHEVVIGIYFSQPIFGLRSEHIGIFWSSIKDQFPNVKQNPVLGPEVIVDPESYPMPRYWFVSDDETNLLQVQKTAFLFNWRRRDAEYPHFEAVKTKFDELYGIFVTFLKEQVNSNEPRISTCELAYINVIKSSKYWSSLKDTSNIIPSFSPVDSGIQNANYRDFDYSTFSEIEPDLILKANLRSAILTNENEEPALILELRTTGILADEASKIDADLWLSRAHDTIIDSFNGMTNTEVQKKLWEREEI